MAIAAIVFIAITVLAYVWLTPVVQSWIESIGSLRAYSSLLGNLAFIVLWWFISSMLYVAIAGILSSFLWERLSVEIERMENTLPTPETKIGCGGTIYDTSIRAFISLFVALSALLLGWLCFGVVGILLAGWLGLMDYTSCAFARRGILVDRQFNAVYKCPGWKSFLLGAGVIALFPFLNVLLLPGLVAGGTLLVGKSTLPR
jgi:uncharacterized protein involved in cysteine biosynthesis